MQCTEMEKRAGSPSRSTCLDAAGQRPGDGEEKTSRECAGTREDDAGQRDRQREFGSGRRRAALSSSSARLRCRCGGSVSAKRSEQWPAVVHKQRRLQGQTTGLASAGGGGWQVSTSAVTQCLVWYSVLLYLASSLGLGVLSIGSSGLDPGAGHRQCLPACLLVGSCCVTELRPGGRGRCVGFPAPAQAGRPAALWLVPIWRGTPPPHQSFPLHSARRGPMPCQCHAPSRSLIILSLLAFA